MLTPLVFQVHACNISSMRRSLLQEVVWKTTQTWLGGKSCFSHTNPSNFRLPLQSLLLRYRAQIYRLPNFNMIFQLVQTQFFKSELFSCLLKDDHVINWWKRPISSSSRRSELREKVGSSSLLAERALFLACFLPCTSRSRGKHSRRLACQRSHVLRAYCNFESKQTVSSTLFGRRPINEFPSIFTKKVEMPI